MLCPKIWGGAVKILNTTRGDLTLQSLNVNVVCFTESTMILTPTGEKAIETLEPSDLVLTQSGAAKQLRAVHRRRIGRLKALGAPNIWPVKISTNALGPNIPSVDMAVSPQHRVLVNSKITLRIAGEPVLLAAKKLLGLHGVTHPAPSEDIIYIHLVFDEHEIICANGCWCESFYPGKQALMTLPKAVADEYLQIFGGRTRPELAAPVLQGGKARNLVARHMRQGTAMQNMESF